MSKRQVVLYISQSLDGYIATKNNGLDWLSIAHKEGLDYNYNTMQERCDTYIVGRRTYDVVCALTRGVFEQSKHHDCYVLTRTARPAENGVQFYTGDVQTLVEELKAQPGKDIYCDGGAHVVHMLMQNQLIDEFIITTIPVLLGDGIRLFKGEAPETALEFLHSESYETGVVQVHYRTKR